MYLSNTRMMKMLFSDPDMFWHMYVKWFGKIAFTKYTKHVIKPKKYAGKHVSADYEGNERIKELILADKPFLVGRPGATEIYLFLQGQMMRQEIRKPAKDEDFRMAYVNTGIFPRTVDFINRYAPYAARIMADCDLLNVSYCVMEDYVYKKYMHKDTELTYIRALDYWRFDSPWTAALKGKKVLVISPFADTIQKQYAIREKLYDNPEILPEFTLYTVKAVQTGGDEKDERFADWFEALEYMYEEAMQYDFDIAILSCGAYSMPLGAKFKAAGKGAIHMGGVCQMLFGIKGRRWQDEPGAGDFFNEYWTYPSAEETPKSASIVENSAYWARDEK